VEWYKSDGESYQLLQDPGRKTTTTSLTRISEAALPIRESIPSTLAKMSGFSENIGRRQQGQRQQPSAGTFGEEEESWPSSGQQQQQGGLQSGEGLRSQRMQGTGMQGSGVTGETMQSTQAYPEAGTRGPGMTTRSQGMGTQGIGGESEGIGRTSSEEEWQGMRGQESSTGQQKKGWFP
jgi:hypothetical protein